MVTPVYNRETEITRCLQSCLQQDFPDFEVVVVDDGSTDRSVEAASAVRDPRIRVFCHDSNRGHGVARNTAIQKATGDWVIFLDSDDELSPGGLVRIYERIMAVGEQVDRLAFRYARDDGRTSPLPPLPDGVMDYPAYCAWLEHRELWDFVSCARRTTFCVVPQPNRYWADQSLYHLDFAWHFRTACYQDVVAVAHTTAPNRTSQLRRKLRLSTANANDLGAEMDLLFARHGEALRRYAPQTYQNFRRMRASYHFLDGNRTAGLALMAQCIKATPLLPEAWALSLLGLVPRSVFAAARSRRRAST
jgi:glycosyltransferase involved in cell wall biosynthesis